MERWKPIAEYEGLYEVSNLGRFKSLARTVPSKRWGTTRVHEKLLTVQQQRYAYVTLYRNGKARRLRVQRLVAKAFIPNPRNLPEVNHKKGRQKWNNAVANLEWATRKENMQHAYDTGLALPQNGSMNGQAKLTEAQVIEMRELYKQGRSMNELADLFDTVRQNVSRIINGQRWVHAGGPIHGQHND